MSNKGVTLVQGQVVVLSLDGTMVYVENVQPQFVEVVALPEQPPERTDGPFTLGKVGTKKISPYTQASSVVPMDKLSDRNKTFIGSYEQLRKQHGVHYIGDDVLRAAAEAAANAPTKEQQKAQAKAAREAAREQKAANKGKASGPRYLQRCTVCGEQPGHPKHGMEDEQHVFAAPVAPVVLCAACDKPEIDHADNALSHRFIAGKAPKLAREPRVPKEPREPKAPKADKPKRSKPGMVDPSTKYRWVENPAMLAALIAGNGKFSPSNSGGAMIETIKSKGTEGISVLEIIVIHPRPLERLQLAFGQLFGAGLLEVAA